MTASLADLAREARAALDVVERQAQGMLCGWCKARPDVPCSRPSCKSLRRLLADVADMRRAVTDAQAQGERHEETPVLGCLTCHRRTCPDALAAEAAVRRVLAWAQRHGATA